MANKNYQVGLLITGDAKKGVKATQLTRDGLKGLSKQQKKTGKSTKDLSSKTGSMMSKLGMVASVVGVATAALGTMGAVMRTQAITEMKVMADTLNISTQTLSEWSTAGEKFNVGGEKMADIFKDLQDKIGDFAATGGGEAKDIFKKLNLDINEFVGLSADQQLLKIGSALDDVASHSEKIFYMEALANDASRLIPLLENGAVGLKTAQEEARLLGTSINDIDAEMIAVAGREMQRTGDIATGLGNTITAAVAPSLGAINSQITDIALSFGGWEGVVGSTVDYTVSAIAFMADRIDNLHTILLYIELGYLKIGKAATNAMASSAESVAELMNKVLTPLGAAIGFIADGWSQVALAMGDFLGDEDITAMGESLAGFSDRVKGLSVDAGDIIAANNAMSAAIVTTTNELENSKNAASGDNVKKWHKDNEKAAKEQAAATVAIKKAQQDLGNQAATNNGASTSELSEDYDKLIKQVDDFSGAWANAGNVIVDTFGSIGQQMEKLFTSQDKYTEAIKFNHAEQAKGGSDLKKLKADEIKLNYASTQAQLNSYSSIAGAAAGMFKENSKAAKAAHAVEQALAVASLAMSIEKMIMGTAETTAVVANESVKQVALGTTAVISQGQGDPYTAWVRIAAMVALVAGLGIATKGGSGTASASSASRQETQGTGTLLGSDDKSASILNSYERIEELELDKYAVLTEMNTSLHDLNSNITHLATSFVSNFGKFDAASYNGQLGKTSKYSGDGAFTAGALLVGTPIMSAAALGLDKLTGGLFGDIVGSIVSSFSTTKKTLTDSGISIVSQTLGTVIDSGLLQAQQYFDIKTKKKSFWGLTSKTNYNTEYSDIDSQLEHEMSLIFASIGSSINSAVDVLGLDVANNINDFIIDLPNISFKDLSGDEIQAELEAMFSSQSDMMATYLVPGLQDFQKVGEGLYETLIRLAQEQAVFNGVLEITGNTLNSIDANQTIAATQAIIDFAGGIENLQSAASDFFNGFYSETEQFEYNQKQLLAQFSALGQELPATAAGFKKLVQGLDPLNEADQRLYAQLLLLSGQTAEYYDALEDQTTAAQEAIDAEKELAYERMQAISSLSDDINQLVDDLVNPSIDYQSLIKDEEQRWKNQQNAADKLYKTEMQRYEGALNAERTLDEYINGLAFSDNSTYSLGQQESFAKSNFKAAVNSAGDGDYSAVSDATSAASQYLDIGKERFGGDSQRYRDMFKYVNTTLIELSDFYADFEAPEQQTIEESPELISLREQLAVSQAAAQQAENQALADLLTSQLGELSGLSGDSIDSLIESFSIDLAQLGELLSVNLVELIEVTKQGVNPVAGDVITGTGNYTVPVDNVVAFPEITNPILPAQVPETTSTNNNNGNYAEVVAELKLLREEVAAFRADSNDNADDAAGQRDAQTTTLEVQTDEIVRSNLRQVNVS